MSLKTRRRINSHSVNNNKDNNWLRHNRWTSRNVWQVKTLTSYILCTNEMKQIVTNNSTGQEGGHRNKPQLVLREFWFKRRMKLSIFWFVARKSLCFVIVFNSSLATEILFSRDLLAIIVPFWTVFSRHFNAYKEFVSFSSLSLPFFQHGRISTFFKTFPNRFRRTQRKDITMYMGDTRLSTNCFLQTDCNCVCIYFSPGQLFEASLCHPPAVFSTASGV